MSRGPRPGWFELEAPFLQVPSFEKDRVPPADVNLATFWTTIAAAAALPGQACHFCQGYEGSYTHNLGEHTAIEAAYATAIPGLALACETHGMPLLSSRLDTATLAEVLGRRLALRLAPSTTLHGTLIDIYGVGVLLLGASGVGKSESALELVLRGHRLVSDDLVVLRRVGVAINGTGPDVSRFHME